MSDRKKPGGDSAARKRDVNDSAARKREDGDSAARQRNDGATTDKKKEDSFARRSGGLATGRGGSGSGWGRERDGSGSGRVRGDAGQRAGHGRDVEMSGRRRNDDGSDNRRGDTEPKTETGKLNDIARDLIRKHSSLKEVDCGISSDSDSTAARFKTPVSKKRKVEVIPVTPVKNKKAVKDCSEEENSGDESHKRSKKLLKMKRDEEDDEDTDREDDDSRDVNKLHKVISKLKRRMKGSLKYQTVKITRSLDKKNKELQDKIGELGNKIEELENIHDVKEEASNEDKEEGIKTKYDEIQKSFEEELVTSKRYRKERNDADKEIKSLKKEVSKLEDGRNDAEKEIKHFKRDISVVVEDRNAAEANAKTMKKELVILTDRIRSVREELKFQIVENSKLEAKVLNLEQTKSLDDTVEGMEAVEGGTEAAKDRRRPVEEEDAESGGDSTETAKRGRSIHVAKEGHDTDNDAEAAEKKRTVENVEDSTEAARDRREAVQDGTEADGDRKKPVEEAAEKDFQNLAKVGRNIEDDATAAGRREDFERVGDSTEAARDPREVVKDGAEAAKGRKRPVEEGHVEKQSAVKEGENAKKKDIEVVLIDDEKEKETEDNGDLKKKERLAKADKKKEAIVSSRRNEYADFRVDGFPSDDDDFLWESNHKFKVGNVIVTNSKDASESRARTVRLPKSVISASKLFKATSFNNQVMFIALNSKSVSTHNPKKGRSICGLPYCSRKWEPNEPIAMVYVFDIPFNPKNETEQWSCHHHAEASINGYILQLQNPVKWPKPIATAGDDVQEETPAKNTVNVNKVDEKPAQDAFEGAKK